MPHASLAPVLDLVYDAAADSALWPSAITAVADFCGGAGGVLFGHSVREGVVAFEYSGRMDEHCNALYKAHHVVNDWSAHMATRTTGETVLSDQILPIERLRRTAFYDEVLRPQSVVRNAMTPLARSGSFQASFDLVRTERQGAFEPRHLARLREVVPHLQRSLRLARRIEGYQALHKGQQDALERLSSGVVLLDREARVLYANKAAQALFGSGCGLTVQAGVLGCREPVQRHRLDTLRKAVLGGQPAASTSLAGESGRPLTLILSSIRGRDLDRFSSFGIADPAAMLFISDARGAMGMSAERVRAAFGLSAAEARVALAAGEGGTVAEIAHGLNLSPNTVKTHLSHVFGKMGITGRVQLVKLLEAAAQVQSCVDR